VSAAEEVIIKADAWVGNAKVVITGSDLDSGDSLSVTTITGIGDATIVFAEDNDVSATGDIDIFTGLYSGVATIFVDHDNTFTSDEGNILVFAESVEGSAIIAIGE